MSDAGCQLGHLSSPRRNNATASDLRDDLAIAQVNQGRWTAEFEDDFVGLYLTEHPEKGLLGYENGFPTIVQYWRSFEHLEAFARDQDDPHLEPWRNYWRRVGKSDRTGIWHETFLVRAGEWEAVYGNMPPVGLGKATTLVPLAKSSTARLRVRRAADADVSSEPG